MLPSSSRDASIDESPLLTILLVCGSVSFGLILLGRHAKPQRTTRTAWRCCPSAWQQLVGSDRAMPALMPAAACRRGIFESCNTPPPIDLETRSNSANKSHEKTQPAGSGQHGSGRPAEPLDNPNPYRPEPLRTDSKA